MPAFLTISDCGPVTHDMLRFPKRSMLRNRDWTLGSEVDGLVPGDEETAIGLGKGRCKGLAGM